MVTSTAEDMERIEIERIPASRGEAQQVYMDGQDRKRTPTAAVRITVFGVDGSEVTDIWTRDRFIAFFRAATLVIADD